MVVELTRVLGLCLAVGDRAALAAPAAPITPLTKLAVTTAGIRPGECRCNWARRTTYARVSRREHGLVRNTRLGQLPPDRVTVPTPCKIATG